MVKLIQNNKKYIAELSWEGTVPANVYNINNNLKYRWTTNEFVQLAQGKAWKYDEYFLLKHRPHLKQRTTIAHQSLNQAQPVKKVDLPRGKMTPQWQEFMTCQLPNLFNNLN